MSSDFVCVRLGLPALGSRFRRAQTEVPFFSFNGKSFGEGLWSFSTGQCAVFLGEKLQGWEVG